MTRLYHFQEWMNIGCNRPADLNLPLEAYVEVGIDQSLLSFSMVWYRLRSILKRENGSTATLHIS